MARPEKAATVERLSAQFAESNAAVLTEYRGLSVKDLKTLRRSLGGDAAYAVAKNTLTKLAAARAGVEGLDDQLSGPTAIAFITGDVVNVARGLRDFAKDNPLLVIKGGVMDGKILDADTVRKLADLESREVLLAKLAGGVAVLGSGLTYKQCYLTPAELQLLDVRKVNTISVARIFGIPARLMLTSGDGDSKTYANMEQESILFVRHTLMPYMREIEQALSSLMVDDVRFNVDGFLRPDTTTRYNAHKIALEAGFLTVDEVRAIEGLNPIEDEDSKEAADESQSAQELGEDPAPRGDDDQGDRDSGDHPSDA